MLLECQKCCVINGGNVTKNFKLQIGAPECNPVSVYLFILRIEIVLVLIKANKRVKGINIFEHIYLYSAYADDTTFFISDKDLLMNLSIHSLRFQSIQD